MSKIRNEGMRRAASRAIGGTFPREESPDEVDRVAAPALPNGRHSSDNREEFSIRSASSMRTKCQCLLGLRWQLFARLISALRFRSCSFEPVFRLFIHS